MNITYLHHSGFLVELDTKVLVFDYYSSNGSYAKINRADYAGKEMIFFSSHAHSDHFEETIYTLGDTFVLSNDIEKTEIEGDVLWVNANESYEFHDMKIETLLSNDEGVAFLVEVEGKTLFHAGDLNWWHWNGEPDTFNDEIKKSYCTEIDRLKGKQIDVAFVAADLRLQDKATWAMDYFMEQIGAKVVFPMHFWGKFRICKELKAKPYGDCIIEITKQNESFIID